MVVLDTTVVSELMRPSPAPAVEAWVARRPATGLFFTAVGEAELRYGLSVMPADRRRDRLAAEIEAMLCDDFEGRVLSFDGHAARAYAEIAAADPRAVAIADAARRLVNLRDRWLNSPEWVEWVDEPVAGYPKRPVRRVAAEPLTRRGRWTSGIQDCCLPCPVEPAAWSKPVGAARVARSDDNRSSVSTGDKASACSAIQSSAACRTESPGSDTPSVRSSRWCLAAGAGRACAGWGERLTFRRCRASPRHCRRHSRPPPADRVIECCNVVLVHGDPGFIKLDASFPEAERIRERIRYTGYVATGQGPAASPGVGDGEIVVSAGGGVVAHRLVGTALESARRAIRRRAGSCLGHL